jgi:hypothetical protein
LQRSVASGQEGPSDLVKVDLFAEELDLRRWTAPTFCATRTEAAFSSWIMATRRVSSKEAKAQSRTTAAASVA